jgi:hypothetical protein
MARKKVVFLEISNAERKSRDSVLMIPYGTFF